MEPETRSRQSTLPTKGRRQSPPLTPQQEQIHQAMIARLDALLTKHEPELYPQWRAIMAEKATKPVGTRLETCALMAMAVFSAAAKRFPAEMETSGYFNEYLEGTSPFGRITRRNERLLARLVLRGCKARGEY